MPNNRFQMRVSVAENLGYSPLTNATVTIFAKGRPGVVTAPLVTTPVESQNTVPPATPQGSCDVNVDYTSGTDLEIVVTAPGYEPTTFTVIGAEANDVNGWDVFPVQTPALQLGGVLAPRPNNDAIGPLWWGYSSVRLDLFDGATPLVGAEVVAVGSKGLVARGTTDSNGRAEFLTLVAGENTDMTVTVTHASLAEPLVLEDFDVSFQENGDLTYFEKEHDISA